MPNVTEEAQYKLLRLLKDNPEATQRQIAQELGISLGRVNYCIRILVEKGYVKAKNFKNSQNKAAYLYLLTPKGVRAKARVTNTYLQRKLEDLEMIKAEIAELKADMAKGSVQQ